MNAHFRPEEDDHRLAKLADAVESVRRRDFTIATLMTKVVATCSTDAPSALAHAVAALGHADH